MSPRGGKRKGAGRPAPEPARSHLHIRISAERKAAYVEAAERTRPGMKLSEWVICVLDIAAGCD